MKLFFAILVLALIFAPKSYSDNLYRPVTLLFPDLDQSTSVGLGQRLTSKRQGQYKDCLLPSFDHYKNVLGAVYTIKADVAICRASVSDKLYRPPYYSYVYGASVEDMPIVFQEKRGKYELCIKKWGMNGTCAKNLKVEDVKTGPHFVPSGGKVQQAIEFKGYADGVLRLSYVEASGDWSNETARRDFEWDARSGAVLSYEGFNILVESASASSVTFQRIADASKVEEEVFSQKVQPLGAVSKPDSVIPYVDKSTFAARGIRLQLASGQDVDLYTNSYALVVGVSDYSNGWPSLSSIKGETSEIATLLTAQGFEVTVVESPSSEELEDAFEDFADSHGYDDSNRLLFYFAGHGFTRQNNTKGYLVPKDAPNPSRDERGFLRKAYPMSDLLALARRIESRHALFLFDSCFSGTIFKSRALPEKPPLINQLTSKPVRQFITAGDAGQTVPAKSIFAPAFRDALLYGLADLNKDSYVTGTELGMYLQDVVTSSSLGSQTPQYGKINDYELARGDFVFLSGERSKAKTARLDGAVTNKMDADALNDLGISFYSGEGALQDPEAAVKWWQSASAQGNTDALHNLGVAYFEGKGVLRSYKEAIRFWRIAADKGSSKSQYWLGRAYFLGSGVDKNPLEAMKWWSKAANQGLAEAQYMVGASYSQGYGVRKDKNEAVEWYKRAASQGNAEAQVNLGVAFESGKGVSQDYVAAVDMYSKAANQGNSRAMVNLGTAYWNGTGIEKNRKEALRLYRSAADKVDPAGMLRLGQAYHYGDEVDQDREKSTKLYLKAANLGYSPGQYFLALAYGSGEGVELSLPTAHMWFSAAAYNGHENAAHLRDLLAKEMSASELSKAEVMTADWMAIHKL